MYLLSHEARSTRSDLSGSLAHYLHPDRRGPLVRWKGTGLSRLLTRRSSSGRHSYMARYRSSDLSARTARPHVPDHHRTSTRHTASDLLPLTGSLPSGGSLSFFGPQPSYGAPGGSRPALTVWVTVPLRLAPISRVSVDRWLATFFRVSSMSRLTRSKRISCFLRSAVDLRISLHPRPTPSARVTGLCRSAVLLRVSLGGRLTDLVRVSITSVRQHTLDLYASSAVSGARYRDTPWRKALGSRALPSRATSPRRP